jgi:uncharacterized membrane protein (UPF0127 family)
MWSTRFDGLPCLYVADGMGVRVAVTPLSRLAGLSLLPSAPAEALLIPRCNSVHTFGMRFALDLVWLDADSRVIDLTTALGPNRIVARRKARAVVECSAGDGARLVRCADQLLQAYAQRA